MRKIVVSVIFALTDSKSKMKAVGGEEFEYNGVEKGVLFISELWNESISADDGTVKTALFYEGNKAVKNHVKGMKKN